VPWRSCFDLKWFSLKQAKAMSAVDHNFVPPPTAIGLGLGAVVSSEKLGAAAALARLSASPHLICHSHFLIERLGAAAQAPKSLIRAAREQRHFDVAELFAFVVPARIATPTPTGFARSLAVDLQSNDSETLHAVVDDLLERLSNKNYPLLREAAELATFLARANWPWAKTVMAALLKANPKMDVNGFATGLNVWDRIEEWEDDGQRAQGTQEGISGSDAKRFLAEILGSDSEARASQRDYAAAATHAFEPRDRKDINNILLAEAGTGLGKR
jgi:ATP-dependent DNA helicase DinG